MTPIEALKKQAAEKAVEQIKNGMVLGLGTGSSAKFAIMKIGELWRCGILTDIVGIPTGQETAELAQDYDIPLASLDDYPVVDLTIDGADEITPNLDLIKGLGGALLREKMIELASNRFVVIADGSKRVEKLGTRSPLPVEVTRFGWKHQARWLESLGCDPVWRKDDQNQPYVTDNDNYILDCTFPNGIDDPVGLATILHERTGIVEHGLFLSMADEAVVADADGLHILK
jgi:ribose 5-phosphate isomerase A